MHPENWPIKGKPVTNAIIHVAIALVVVGAFAVEPIIVCGVLAILIVFYGGRSVVRELWREWRPKREPEMVRIGPDGTKKLNDTDEGKLFQIVGVKNTCPDCGGIGFFEGPRGGMSMNIICKNAACRSKFNLTCFSSTQGTVDRIGRDPISALDTFPRESFGANLTDEQLAAAKAKIIADETPPVENAMSAGSRRYIEGGVPQLLRDGT